MHTRRWKQNVKEVGFVFLVLLLLLHKNGAKRGKSEMLRDSGGISIVRDDVSHAYTYIYTVAFGNKVIFCSPSYVSRDPLHLLYDIDHKHAVISFLPIIMMLLL